jgi:cytochrome c-type biogenesis protein CcmH/NrfG
MGSLTQAVEAAQREVASGPADASAWERLGRLRLRRFDRTGAREALEQARRRGPSEQGLLDLALVANLAGDVGTEVSACEQATDIAPQSSNAWSRLAHALARTDRLTECLAACERALSLGDDAEVRNLRAQVLAAAPRELAEQSAAA